MAKRVLIVEDGPFRETLARYLGVYGVTADVATSLFEARKLLGNHYHAIVWDANLPDGSSIDLIAETHHWFKGPMFGISTLEYDRIRQKRAGCSKVCEKPEVLELLARALGLNPAS